MKHCVKDEGNTSVKAQKKAGNRKRKADSLLNTVEINDKQTSETSVRDKIFKSQKSTARLEKKKLKAVALLNIIESNEKDKKSKQKNPVSSKYLFNLPAKFKLRLLQLDSSEINKLENHNTDIKTIKARIKATTKNVPRFALKGFGEKASLALTTEKFREVCDSLSAVAITNFFSFSRLCSKIFSIC